MGGVPLNVHPDGFIGTVIAVEGIADATTLLHGPDGCRKNLSSLSSKVFPGKPSVRNDLSTPYFHGMDRVPCTGVLSDDYISGAQRKVHDALAFVSEKTGGLVAVVCTPGASLIGDDVGKAIGDLGLESRVIDLGPSQISLTCAEGMDLALRRIAEFLIQTPAHKVAGTVNVLGLSVITKDWTAVRAEFAEVLGLIGLKVNCFLGAGCTTEEVRSSAESEFNIVLCPEYCRETSRYYEERLGIPSVGLGYAPVGFESMTALMELVSSRTGRDAGPSMAYIRRFMDRAYGCMRASRISVRGRTFAVDADPSVAYPLTKWLFETLSMVPASVAFNGESFAPAEDSLSTFLHQNGLQACLGAEPPDYLDVMFCNGNTAQLYELPGNCRRGVDVCFPSIQNVDFRESPVLGCRGALYLLDRVMKAV